MYSICKYLWNIYIYIYLYVFIIQAFDLPANACQSNQRSKILGALGCYRLVIWHSWLEQCTTHRPVLSFLRNMWEISWTFPSGCLNVNFGVAFKNLHVFLNPNKLEDFNSWHKWRFCVNNLVFLHTKKNEVLASAPFFRTCFKCPFRVLWVCSGWCVPSASSGSSNACALGSPYIEKTDRW